MSSAPVTLVLLLLAGMTVAKAPGQAGSAAGNAGHGAPAAPAAASVGDAAQFFRRGQDVLTHGQLDEAERLLPQVAGIRLNVGLAYYRQNEFLKAIPPFESVVRDLPDAWQARYLLGLCHFFAERWADAAATLEPLWAQESGQGKYHLNFEQYDQALTEVQAAADANPKLPFVHFNLGLTYLKKQDYEHARDEFLKDAVVEPDLALDYDELGDVYWLMQDDNNAEKSYREALRRDARLVNSHFGLAKTYQREDKYAQALAEIDAAGQLDPARTDIYYVWGQLLVHMGRKEEGKKELEAAVRLDNERRAERQKQMETLPSPELLQDPQ